MPIPPIHRRAFMGVSAAAAGLSCAPRNSAVEDALAALDESLSDLKDVSRGMDPIRENQRATRRRRFARLLERSDLDALLVEPGATMEYFCGVSWGRSERLTALVLLADGSHFWIVPGFEKSNLVQRIEGSEEQPGAGGDIVPWQEHEYPYAPLAAELAARKVKRLAIDGGVRSVFALRLARELGLPALLDGIPAVGAMRSRKDSHEILLLRRANEVTQTALRRTAELIVPGMTSGQISTIVRRAQELQGLKGIWDLTLIGPEAANPHGKNLETVLARGDVLLIDTGGSLHGYQSDNTRTWVPDGPLDSYFESVWHAVQDAQQKAFEAMRPGVECRTIDEVARESLAAAGFGERYKYFSHRLGHGIGLEGHEDPYFDGGSEVILADGMTFSDEPGVYLPGNFGVRLEDCVVITESGADHFGSWQQSPNSPD